MSMGKVKKLKASAKSNWIGLLLKLWQVYFSDKFFMTVTHLLY